MIIEDIYKSKILKHPLTDDEIELLDQCWNLLDIMNMKYIFIFEYRDKLIKYVSKNYTPEEFYKIESIVNKLFWNLRWLIYPLFTDQISKIEYENIVNNNFDNISNLPYSMTLCDCVNYIDDEDLKNKIKNSNAYNDEFYRSYINKIIIVDKLNKILYTKPMEGSSSIFNKNYFNLLTMTILFNRKTYTKIMHDPYRIRKTHVKVSNFYYQYDYGFPNLNFCVYSFGTDEDRLNRIRKMYFNGDSKYWKKLII